MLSPAVELRSTPHQGRFLVATRDIAEATDLLTLPPYALCALDAYRKRVCARCAMEFGRSSKARMEGMEEDAAAGTDGNGAEGGLEAAIEGAADEAADDRPRKPPQPANWSIRCVECDQVFYCSERCETWNRTQGCHEKVCKSLRAIRTNGKLGAHEKSLMKLVAIILLRRWRERKDHRGQFGDRTVGPVNIDGTSSNISALPSLLNNLSLASSPDSSPWSPVCALQSHLEDWPPQALSEWRKPCRFLTALLEKSGLIDEDFATSMLASRPFRPGGEGGVWENNELAIMHLISVCESNGFGVWAADLGDAVVTECDGAKATRLAKGGKPGGKRSGAIKPKASKTPPCIGRALYPSASFFNHACEPNVEAVQIGRDRPAPDAPEDVDVDVALLTFRTMRAVKAGEELCISYVDGDEAVASRRGRLKDDYYFECRCARCEAEVGEGRKKKGRRY
ncbi:hypothetical protein HK101_008552 [Irineochytrium annulatum]|nr:hypothetical protein HK101_008552 [Irineochytrium annulatum]